MYFEYYKLNTFFFTFKSKYFDSYVFSHMSFWHGMICFLTASRRLAEGFFSFGFIFDDQIFRYANFPL